MNVFDQALSDSSNFYGKFNIRPFRRFGLFGIVAVSLLLHGLAFAALGLCSIAEASETLPAEISFSIVGGELSLGGETSGADSVPEPKKVRVQSHRAQPSAVASESSIAVVDAVEHADSGAEQEALSNEGSASIPTSGQGSSGGSALSEGHGGGGGSANIAGLTRGWISAVGQLLFQSAARRYPSAARLQRLEGTVALLVRIDALGAITKVSVKTSSGHSVLDHAALAAVRSIGRVPAPPSVIHWRPRAFTLPIVYRLN
ncbi:MAG: TonB family protein [Myxococcales bacterium]|nr:MAG: TonB family protein [Myxococcales bacterium]